MSRRSRLTGIRDIGRLDLRIDQQRCLEEDRIVSALLESESRRAFQQSNHGTPDVITMRFEGHLLSALLGNVTTQVTEVSRSEMCKSGHMLARAATVKIRTQYSLY